MSNRSVENYELISSDDGSGNIVFIPPEGMPYTCNGHGASTRSCVSYDSESTKTDYIEYWKCGSYAYSWLGNQNLNQLNSISVVNQIINSRFDRNFCTNHAYDYRNDQCTDHWFDPGGDQRDNPCIEGWSYVAGDQYNIQAHPNGYRDKNSLRQLEDWIIQSNNNVLTSNCISSEWINALSTSLSTEIRARLANYLYSNKENDVGTKIDQLVPNQNFIDGNIIKQLRDAMNLLSSGVMIDTGANLQNSQSIIPNSKNISTTQSDIAKTEVKKFINDCNKAYQDCICYSDCGGYAVCFCYGNCNYY